jgi:putative FmdB family regulatory protein
MPTYDYQCQDCHLQFEARHSIHGPSPDCPSCGGPARKLLLTAPAMHGRMAKGRETAMRSLEPKPDAGPHVHGPGCGCGAHHHS